MDIQYLSGIYYIKTDSLLNDDDYVALKRFDKPTFLRYLKTKGYGVGSNYHFLEEVIVQETINVRDELLTLAQDNFIFSAFHAAHDLTNIKIAWKSLNHNVTIMTSDHVSLLSIEALKELFKYDNDKLIPESYKPLMKQVKTIDEGGEISEYLQRVEQTVFDYYEKESYSKRGYKELAMYLTLSKVVTNMKTLLKLKTRNNDIKEFEKAILDENVVTRGEWLDLYRLEGTDFLTKVYVLFDDVVREGVEDFLTTEDPLVLNESLSTYIGEKVKFYSLNTSSVGPIVNYLYLKEVESMKVKALYYAK